jgi:hypothetical protein
MKKLGDMLFAHGAAEQSRSHATSGQLPVFGADAHTAPVQHEDRHRSPAVNTTRAGGVALAYSDPARIPYSTRSSTPPRS